jgi:hypothetical protein
LSKSLRRLRQTQKYITHERFGRANRCAWELDGQWHDFIEAMEGAPEQARYRFPDDVNRPGERWVIPTR